MSHRWTDNPALERLLQVYQDPEIRLDAMYRPGVCHQGQYLAGRALNMAGWAIRGPEHRSVTKLRTEYLHPELVPTPVPIPAQDLTRRALEILEADIRRPSSGLRYREALRAAQRLLEEVVE